MNNIDYKILLSSYGIHPRVVLCGPTVYFSLILNGQEIFAPSYKSLYDYIIKHHLNQLKLF